MPIYDEIHQLIDALRENINGNLANDRARSLAITKLDELELWLTRTNIQN